MLIKTEHNVNVILDIRNGHLDMVVIRIKIVVKTPIKMGHNVYVKTDMKIGQMVLDVCCQV